MVRDLDWYVHCLSIGVVEDLENNPDLVEQLGVFKNKFIKWCSIQRVTYEKDIFDEVKEFTEKVIKKRLYNFDVKLWKRISKRVFERDNFTCFYCGQVGGRLEVDHKLPISKGGTNDLENLVTSCRKCNRQKKDKTVGEFLEWRSKH